MFQQRLMQAVALTIALSGIVAAQDPNHTLSVSSATAQAGGSLDLTVNYDNVGPDSIAGWSFGVGHDSAALMLDGVVDGSTTATVNGGTPPQFNQVNQFVDGFTVGVVISFTGQNPLPPGTGYELNVAWYTNNQASRESTDVCFTDLLGAPPVTTVVVVAGQSVIPVQNCGTVSADCIDCGWGPFLFTANDALASLLGSFTTTCSITDIEGLLDDTQGFSMALSNDPAVITPVDLVPTGPLAAIGGGAGPGFFGDAQFPDGWTVGVVYSFTGGVFIQFPVATDVVEATYDIVSTEVVESTNLVWSNGLGMPTVANVVVVGGATVPVAFDDGVVTFNVSPPPPYFLRGDCNNDGIIDIADGIWLLNELFLGGPATACVAACDANGDTMVDSSDATYIFQFRFLGGAAPVAPFPACGDSSLDADFVLGCAGSSCP